MLQSMIDFFDAYPNNLLQINGKRPADVDCGLMWRLNDYKERQQLILDDTHAFRIDEDAEWMLRRLITEMKEDGLDGIFYEVKLPFPAILLHRAGSSDDATYVGFVTQVDESIYTQRFIVQKSGLAPSLIAFKSSGTEISILPTPTQEFIKTLSGQQDMAETVKEEQAIDNYFLCLAVALSTLISHRGMLDVEENPLFSRPERRRAEKAGHLLPSTRVSTIVLGKAGRGQFDAMREGAVRGENEKIRRRAHWVRGHFMRNRAGGLSWRMPHIRGVGPLITQKRHVTAGET